MTTSTDAVPSLLEPTPMKEGQFGDKEPEFRMDAYYYGFAPTGLLVIDRILSAVACAGKSFHHTDCWTDQCTPYDHLRGETVTDWIQNAADDAADAIRRAPASKVQADHIADELREASRQFHNLTQGDPTVIIRPPSTEKRDAIVAAGERLRAALAASSTGNQEVGSGSSA